MPAPGSYPDWDTNGTHTTAIVSGHASDGFVNNEIPTSAELNQVLMLIGLWIRYLAKRESHVLPILPSRGQVACTVVNPGWFNSAGSFYAQHINDSLILTLPFEPGAHITQVVGTVADGLGGAGGFEWDMKLWKRDITGNTSPVQIGSTQTSGGASGIAAVNLTIGSLNETVAANFVYFLTFSPHAGATVFNTYAIYGAQATYDIPAI